MSTPETRSTPDRERAFTDLAVEAREILGDIATLLIERERRERAWTTIKRTGALLAVLAMLVIWATLYAPMLGWSKGPSTEGIAVIPITGGIGTGSPAGSARTLVPLIERACRSSQSKALVLAINSPGGAPGDADRIGQSLATCKADGRAIPVYAVIEGTGASAAYLIAARTDRIYAARYALVGSLGAVMRNIDAADLAHRLGVRERVYASGTLKSGNGTLSPNTPEQDALNQELVNSIGEIFTTQIRELRGKRLQDDPDLFSGRVWTAPDALKLGLIDEVGSLEELRQSALDGAPIHEYRPRETLQDRLGLTALVGTFASNLTSGLRETHLE